MNDITRFMRIYYFLSNMYPYQIKRKGMLYHSSENAYQAQKTSVLKIQQYIITLGPKYNKTYTKNIKKVDNWHEIKVNVMKEILYIKFQKMKD